VNNDEGGVLRASRPSQLKWDRKKKKMVSTDQVGADNKKMIRSESGALLPASYKSGRFEEWRKKRKHAGASGQPDERESRPTRFHANVSMKTFQLSLADIPQSRHAAQHRTAKSPRSEIKTTAQIMGQREIKAKVSLDRKFSLCSLTRSGKQRITGPRAGVDVRPHARHCIPGRPHVFIHLMRSTLDVTP
jgi:hypothetical protein